MEVKVKRYERHTTVNSKWFHAKIWHHSMKLEIDDTGWMCDWTADEAREYAKFLLAAADVLEELKRNETSASA